MNRQQHSEFSRRNVLSRRKFLEGTTALGASTVLATSLAGTSSRAETPNKGGTLKLAMAGGSSTDSMDTATTNDIVGIFNDFTTFNCLAELTPDREVIPELAESWEARPGAQEWVLNIRKDVEFHNGKTVDVEDVLFSINRHRGEDSHSGATGAVSGISDVKILDRNQVLVTLHSPNADLPYVFTDYHIAIVPKDFSDWANPVGSGPYKMVNYNPGVGMYSERNPNYWKEGARPCRCRRSRRGERCQRPDECHPGEGSTCHQPGRAEDGRPSSGVRQASNGIIGQVLRPLHADGPRTLHRRQRPKRTEVRPRSRGSGEECSGRTCEPGQRSSGSSFRSVLQQ